MVTIAFLPISVTMPACWPYFFPVGCMGGLIELKGPRRLKKQHVRRVLGQSLLHRTIRKGHLFYIGKMRTIKVSISDQKMVASKAISKLQFFVELVDCKTTLQQFILEKFSPQLRLLRYSHGSWLSLPGQVVVPATKIPSTLVETIAKKCLWSNPHIKFCAKSTLQNSDFRSVQFLHAKNGRQLQLDFRTRSASFIWSIMDSFGRGIFSKNQHAEWYWHQLPSLLFLE